MTYPRLIGGLVFVIPALILVVPGAGEVSFGILVLLGLAKTIKERRNPVAEPGNRFLAIICWIFLGVAIISVVANDPSHEGLRRLGTSIHFLLAPFIGVLLLTTPDIFTRLVQGVKAGAILAGINAIIEYWFLSQERANGAVNVVVFGDLALLLGFLAMVNFFKETPKEKTLSALALALALIAALLSETRNAWVAAPILTLTLMFVWWRGGHLSTRRVVATLVVAVFAIVVCANTPVFQKRYIEMTTELRNLDDYSRLHSVKDRVVMWKAAWKTSGESLILGHGLHNANTAILPHVHPSHNPDRISKFTHLHNEFINTLVGKGLLGLVSLLLLLLGPIVLLRKLLKPGPDYPVASMGILTCSGFVLFGLTNLAFGHGIMNTFFVVMLATVLNRVTFPISHETEPVSDRKKMDF